MGFLAARNFLSGSACKTPEHMTEYDQPFIGNISFYHFNVIISGASTLIVFILMISLMHEHACRLSNPSEQLKIMKILNMLPGYSLLAYVAIIVPDAYVYLNAWIEVFQAMALFAFFMLLLDFLAPTDEDKFRFFASLKVKKMFKKDKQREGVSFLKLTYYSLVQYPICVVICAVLQSVTQSLNRYCLDSDSPAYGHIWIELISNISVTIAVNAIIRFYAHTKEYMKEHHPLRKLLAFKLMIGLIFFESVAFMILEATDVLHQSSKISYADIHIGLPNMIICIQAVPFAILMRWAYPSSEYKLNGNSDDYAKLSNENGVPVPTADRFRGSYYQGGTWGYRAWLIFLNPWEYIYDGARIGRLLKGVRVRHQTIDAWPEPSQDEGALSAEEGQQDSTQPIAMTQYDPTDPRTAGQPVHTVSQYAHPQAQYAAYGPSDTDQNPRYDHRYE